ncbi:hypothetical protein DRN82_07050, partial [Thermococci archaeon]
MAYDIKENGLPQETVKALKEQGWSDADIKALEAYIAKNADKINGDFDMEEFLVNMSRAFVDVGFKYNEYERWALEKWLWKVKGEPLKPTKHKEINPALAFEWVNFYSAYAEGDIQTQLSWITKLRDKILEIITGMSVGLGPLNRSTVYREGGGVNFMLMSSSRTAIVTKFYYWPNALKAYELAGNIRTILLAMSLGNRDRRLEGILNEKVSELRSSLVVYKLGESKKYIVYKGLRWPLTETAKTGIQSLDINQILSQTLALEENEGKLLVTVEVVPVKITESYVKYKLKIKLKAKDNAVRDLKIKVSGDGLKYSETVDILHPEDGS